MMKTNEMTINTCAKCGKEYKGRGALSRVDNLTVICPDCGTREALESIGVDKVEQDKILGVIHNAKYRLSNMNLAVTEMLVLFLYPFGGD